VGGENASGEKREESQFESLTEKIVEEGVEGGNTWSFDLGGYTAK